MIDRNTEHLRVLIANERKDRLALVVPIVASLGHEVIAREIEVEDVGPVIALQRQDRCLCAGEHPHRKRGCTGRRRRTRRGDRRPGSVSDRDRG